MANWLGWHNLTGMEGPHKRTRPTVRDVARQAEVSVWTASNTFSNPDRVAAATRQRVLDAADALGYVGPNPGARALALGRSNLVAMATSEPERLLSDPAAALIAQGVLTVCSRAGISMVLTAQADELLVDGRIEFRGAFDATRRPCVTVADVAVTNVPTIRPNLDPGIAALADYLRSMGHRRVAMLSVPGDENRLELFGHHFDAADVPVFRSSAESDWPTRGAGEALARRALRGEERPTALIALSDVVAAGALDTAHALGLRVPEDVTIVGIDDTPGADTLGLTTIVVPYRPMGELAASTLLRWIDGGERPVDPPPLPTALSIRRTSGPAPATD